MAARDAAQEGRFTQRVNGAFVIHHIGWLNVESERLLLAVRPPDSAPLEKPDTPSLAEIPVVKPEASGRGAAGFRHGTVIADR